MHQLFLLFENASGYSIFKTSEFEEVGVFIPQVRKSILDISKFRTIVTLVAFQPFKDQKEALENMKCIAEGKLHEKLQMFLELIVPKSKKSSQPVCLGVQEEALAAAIKDTLNIVCTTSGPVTELVRGVRVHFAKLVKAYKDSNTITKSQLSLGHHYARDRLNFSVDKFDGMIPQNVKMLDQLEKDINTLTVRIREWYSFHFPELIKIVSTSEEYVKCVKEIGDRNKMPEDISTRLQSIINDEIKVNSIIKASTSSMGMDIAPDDMDNIRDFIEQILSLLSRKTEISDYLKLKMEKLAPSLSSLMGNLVGARLISQAGNLINLSKLPSSTVQVLGAEKSLFRMMKKKGKKPSKFSSLDKKSTVIGKPNKSVRSHRILASKCCLAARKDCFAVKPNSSFGSILKKEFEDKIAFYENIHRNKLL